MSAAPRISLILLACNQQATVRAAAEACLAQTGEPLEIVFSDDASSDNSFAELQAAADAYRGPHQVRARRNPVNLGIGAHYNQLMLDTSGALIVTAAGDDLSVPHRVQRLAQAWDASKQCADLIASHFVEMSPDGALGTRITTDDLARVTLDGWVKKTPYTVGATHAFTRRIMRRFGPFIDDVWYEDRIMVLRAITSGGALTVEEPLVQYRVGGTSHQPHTHTGERLLNWTRTQNRRVLAEIAQLTQDARIAGCEAEVAASLAPTLQRETYLRAMLDAQSRGARWRAAMANTQLPLGWRVRKFMTFSFTEQAAAIKRVKARLRGK
ncbi:MAG: glycosyltransferase [Burkholderiales bacterium]|nr:glycosyltransferase [Burkholderiales bacterium]